MKISEKIITGMFKYHDDILFTKDDFVISPNNFLYIVLKEVQGKNPDLGYPEYYSPYGAEEKQNMATYDDFVKYISSSGNQSELGNKTLTLGLLSQILDSYLMGINSSGKIVNKIFTDEIWFSDYLGNITKMSCDNNPLDIIMENPEINHGYFVIENKIILSNFLDLPGEILSQISEDSVGVLRQYTYDNEFGYTIRIQEIIEATSGNIFFRYAINTEGKDVFNKNRISTWRGYTKIVDYVDGVPTVNSGKSLEDVLTNDNYTNTDSYQNTLINNIPLVENNIGNIVNYNSTTFM